MYNTATTTPLLSFSESITDFSEKRHGAIYAAAQSYERAKLCVPFAVASSVRDMDVESERCVKKVVIYSGQKTNRRSVFLLTFSSDKKKQSRRQGENTATNNRNDWASADEP